MPCRVFSSALPMCGNKAEISNLLTIVTFCKMESNVEKKIMIFSVNSILSVEIVLERFSS